MTKSGTSKKQVPLIGKLAVKYNFITKAGLKRGLALYEEAQKEGRETSLPEIFVRTKAILPENMKKLHKIKIDYEAKQARNHPLTNEISLIISEDRLKVELLIPTAFQGLINTENVFEKLQNKGVKHGIVKEYEIRNYINNKKEHGKSKLVARGTPVYNGKPPNIECFFDSGFFRDEALTVDSYPVKRQAKIPEVEEGDLLIKKLPMIPSDSGIDVFGELIRVEPFDDILMRAGFGTDFFEDNMKIVATKSGTPFFSVDGRVNVFSPVNIKGDYGVSSGPVSASSSLFVKGIITGEYDVHGGSIVAGEIRGARIDILGDINVEIGITGSVIKCQGDVNAKYIHSSVIETYGSVITEKEILDSTIISSGICKSKESRIISSDVAAKRGVKAKGIGSEFSRPCEIKIGFDLNAENQIKKIGKKIEENTGLISGFRQEIIEMEKQQKEMKQKIIVQMDLHTRLKNAIESTETKIAEIRQKKTDPEFETAQKTLVVLKRKNTDSILSIRETSDQVRKIRGDIETIPGKIDLLEKESEELKTDRDFISKWSDKNQSIPILDVEEDISAGTIISGAHSFYTLDQKKNRVIAREKKILAEPCRWEIVIEQPGGN